MALVERAEPDSAVLLAPVQQVEMAVPVVLVERVVLVLPDQA